MERSVKLPKHMVVIGFFNDALICLDTSKMKDGECPVAELSEDYDIVEILADSFGRFLYDYESEE